ncbi:universal stress protein [Sphaerospermopsis aphanizomenoides BCCUSP55]|uniref:universal stress protein n=1 Tax=Sphaerospermopsis aphanizomenoides TaxID=459663 RepID=UPI00190331B1|nr:universal stress protein [Sphaerospermopsis aphanizomenoides]MBK1988388.1 universal stress protein [Sphaerospermopsis aphanizomenoides BCCUSP55]
MKVKPLLARLQSAIGRYDLMEQMILLPAPQNCMSDKDSQANSINLIVGYNASPNSHTALDIAFCIAHQTKLATNIQVNVQAVYVLEEHSISSSHHNLSLPQKQLNLGYGNYDVTQSKTSVLTQSKPQLITNSIEDKADKILWQAKNLAEEWQSYFKSHLRFGNLCAELKKVVELEAADVLVLGCQSSHHPLIDSLANDFPCAVLGIPSCLD